MKVCLINNLYKPYAVGGAEKVVEEQVKVFLGQGEQVVLITWRPWFGFGSWRPVKTVEDGVVVYRFWVPNIFSYKNLGKHNLVLKLIWHFFDIFNFWSARIIKKILVEEQIAEVYTHNLMGVGVYKVHKIIKFLKSETKWVHYLHDVQLVEPSGVLPWNHKQDNWYQKIYSLIIKYQMGTPDVIISPSNFLKEFYQSRGFFGKSEWRVEKYKSVESIKNKLSSESIKFLFVGSLVEHKGLEVLMQAWEGVEKGELSIVGNGILFKKIETWCKKYPNVKVCGRKERIELEEIYKNSDVLIFPSICLENRPIVLLEAMKFGLKVVASNTGGVSETLEGYDNLKLIEPGNVEQFKKAILLND